jgi:bis(5'-nucleosyl)-tetraphosphatase (symmetrical)
MSTYAVGDVQGCAEELRRLMESVHFDPAADTLWLVGDLVNRGPASLAVLRLLQSLGDRCVAVLGNHDLHLLAVAAGHARLRADDTLDEVLAAPDCNELLAWLRACPLLHVEGAHAMVHAGLLPQWDITTARARAEEIETALRGPDHDTFLAHLYGSKPTRWDDGLRGADRLRVIVNAMTRMRFCSTDGEMEFASKGGLDSAPQGYLPWFDVPGRASGRQTLICGHWSALGLVQRPDLVALDTGCAWGGSLTAVCLEDGRVFQQPALGPGRPMPRQ